MFQPKMYFVDKVYAMLRECHCDRYM